MKDRSLSDIASIAWSRAWWIVLGTVAGMVLAILVSAVMPAVYRVDVSLVAVIKEDVDLRQRPDLTRILGTWVYVLGDSAVRARAEARLLERYDSDSLRSARISISPIDNSMVVALTVRAGTPELAVDFAQALFDLAGASEVARPFPITLLNPPQAPQAPEWPKHGRNILLGAVAGFLVGLALAFLVDDLGRSGWQLPQVFRRAR
jgi:capsular polysaccharide biosynthesis protein